MRPFNHAGEFSPLSDNTQLAQLTIRNAGVTVFAQATVFAIQLIGTLILVRILTPSDFGLVTMVTTFSLLLASFGLAGFTEAVIQTEKIDHALASNLFWLNCVGGLTLSIAFGAAGSLLARFYGDPRITHVSIGFSVVIFFSVLPVLHLSLLKRAMRFGVVSLNDIAGRVAYVATAICAACMGCGYWALVAGAVVQQFVVCIGAVISCTWLPSLPRRLAGTGKMVRYAAGVYGRYSLNYYNGNTDNLLVGWRFGAHALGVYKKAYDLFILPCCQLLSPILAVVVTTLSRKKNDLDEYKHYLSKGLCLVAFVGMGVGASLTLIGNDVVRLVLGPKWIESGRIFSFFAPGIGFMLIYQATSWIHLSLGTMRRWLRWTAAELIITALLFLLGLHWGPAGIAGAWTVSFCILIVPAFWYAGKPIELPVSSLIGAMWKYLAAAAIAGVMWAAIQTFAIWSPLATAPGSTGALMRIITTSTSFALLYFGAIVILFGNLEPLSDVVRLLPHLLPGALARPALASER